MTKNMGKIDKTIRTILALVLIAIIFAGQLTGAAAVILGIGAAVLIITSFMGVCPLYIPLKISTICKNCK